MRVSLLLLSVLFLSACDSSESGVVEADSNVTVAYEGRLTDGTVFDSSERATFNVSGLITGFQEGIIGMVEGEMRTFEIAPEDGYGAAGIPGVIPPNATLIFDVTLISIN